MSHVSLRRTIIGLCTFLIGIALLFLPCEDQRFSFLWCLPFFTGILFLIVPCYRTNNLAYYLTLLVEGGIFIRNAIAPLFLNLSDYASEINGFDQRELNTAIVLMVIETLFILITVNRMTRYFVEPLNEDTHNSIIVDIDCGQLFVGIMIILLFVCITCTILNRSILSYYSISWRINLDTARLEKKADTAFTIFSLSFEIVKLMVIVWGFSVLTKRSNTWIKTLFICLLIAVPSLFSSENYGFVLINIAVSTIFAISVFPLQRKRLFRLSLIMGLLIFIAIFSVKSNSTSHSLNMFDKISVFLQGYFGGITNVAGSLRLGNINKATCLFYDIYYMIPFRNSIFGIPGDFRSTVFFNYINGVNSQIIPCVGQGFLYIGFLSSIMSSILIYGSFRFLRSIENQIINGFDYVILFMSFYFAVTPFMYNYTILGSWILMVLVPALLVFKAAKRFRLLR